MPVKQFQLLVLPVVFLCVMQHCLADDKTVSITVGDSPDESRSQLFSRPASTGIASRKLLTEGDAQVPLVVVRGTPYEMGRQLGTALKQEIHAFVPAALKGIASELSVTIDDLREVWARTAAYADDRVEQEMLGVADGCGISLSTLQAVHAVPLMMPYSCSSIAAWGEAMKTGICIRLETLTGIWRLAPMSFQWSWSMYRIRELRMSCRHSPVSLERIQV